MTTTEPTTAGQLHPGDIFSLIWSDGPGVARRVVAIAGPTTDDSGRTIILIESLDPERWPNYERLNVTPTLPVLRRFHR